MQTNHSDPTRRKSAFSLVEMLVVIAIMSILMTAGSIGISGMSGKGVSSGVATAESLFEEARTIAIGRNLRTCVLIGKSMSNNPADCLRRILVATEEVDPTTGIRKQDDSVAEDDPGFKWTLTSRGALLPDQTFFSAKFSKKDMTVTSSWVPVTLTNVSNAYKGQYYIYRFNAQGRLYFPPSSTSTGATFVIGSGMRNITRPAPNPPGTYAGGAPVATASTKRDFGGFVIWRNGRTSVYRNPSQISSSIPLTPGTPF